MMVKEGVTDWRRIGQKEIRPGTPAGDPVRDDTSFERLRAEMKKLDGLSQQPVAWEQVISFGKEILAEKSKDLLVGTYLCYGLFQHHGYGGLRDGLSCLEALVSSHWDSMYPEASQIRARKIAVEWLTSRLAPAVSTKPPQRSDRDALKSCLKSMTTLEGTLRQKLGGDIAAFAEFKDLLEGFLNGLHAPSSGVNGVGKNSDLAAMSPVRNASTDSSPTGQPMRALRTAVDLVRGAASTAREQDSRLAWPYRATRAMVWLEIDDYPPHVAGKTKIPPPPARSQEIYAGLMNKTAWSELLHRAESEICEWPFWVDLQRFSLAALKHLGSEYSGAMRAASAECEVFYRRLPELVTFEFSDGQPFADNQTRSWISKDVLSRAEQRHEERKKEESTTDTGMDRLAELRRQWASLTAEGRLRDALDVFQRELIASASQRGQFLARLELAKLCVEAGQLRLADAQFALLNQAGIRLSLEDWEPQLSLEMLVEWWRALRQLARETKPPAPEILKQADEVYNRLSRLDLLTAFDVMDSKLH